MCPDHQNALEGVVTITALGELAVAVWRIERRAKRSSATPESVLIACETASDRLRDLGVEIKDLTGEAYDENMSVRVVDHELGGDEQMASVTECLSPAVYFNDILIKQAEVTVIGGRHG